MLAAVELEAEDARAVGSGALGAAIRGLHLDGELQRAAPRLGDEARPPPVPLGEGQVQVLRDRRGLGTPFSVLASEPTGERRKAEKEKRGHRGWHGANSARELHISVEVKLTYLLTVV